MNDQLVKALKELLAAGAHEFEGHLVDEGRFMFAVAAAHNAIADAAKQTAKCVDAEKVKPFMKHKTECSLFEKCAGFDRRCDCGHDAALELK